MEQKRLYYFDGYHGGIRGHMPLGAWRDIFEQMKVHPEWCLNIDVEPISWDYLQERDPEAYEEFVGWLKENSQRVEIVAGSYAQPYGWVTDGESNIRHLVLGRAVIRRHFPEITVDTYAVQEPCWTSALPQILRQLGYRRASLKNASTAWAGYCAGYPGEFVDWIGPDGTAISTVPRYECEELVPVYSTEAVFGTETYVEKCIQNGIPHPVGMYFQDLGWSARPGVSNPEGDSPEYVEYTTIRRYFEQAEGRERPGWQPGQEIFCGALPWGDRILVRLARQVRRCEVEMLDTERLCAAASLYGMEKREERLTEAWGHLLMTQHHDGWICASVGEEGEEGWAFRTSAQVYAAEFIYDKLNREAFRCIHESFSVRLGDEAETVTVFHPLARAEKRLIRVEMTAKKGVRGFAVYDGEKRIPCQAVASRWYQDGSWNAGTLLFSAELPALGFKTFKVCPLRDAYEEPAREDRRFGQGSCGEGELVEIRDQEKQVLLKNSCLSVIIDLKRGGVITSYYDKVRQQEIVPEGAAFNEFRGYFIEKGRFCSNTEQPADVQIVENGCVEASVEIHGKIADVPYVLRYGICEDDPKLDVKLCFTFENPTYIGEPHEIPTPEEPEYDPHRSYHDGRYRMNAYFPTVFAQKHIDKDCAYDVCRSKLKNTHFQSWTEIKHNILLHWADVTDDRQGLCVFCDHTTAYIHGEDTSFGLALAWGYDGGYWWGRRSLQGSHQIHYQLMAHSGNWKEAALWHIGEQFLHQPMARRCLFASERQDGSIFEILSEGVQLGAFYYQNDAYYIRVFHAGETGEVTFRLNRNYFREIEETAPDGTSRDRYLAVDEDGVFRDVIPAFGIRTYRLGN